MAFIGGCFAAEQYFGHHVAVYCRAAPEVVTGTHDHVDIAKASLPVKCPHYLVNTSDILHKCPFYGGYCLVVGFHAEPGCKSNIVHSGEGGIVAAGTVRGRGQFPDGIDLPACLCKLSRFLHAGPAHRAHIGENQRTVGSAGIFYFEQAIEAALAKLKEAHKNQDLPGIDAAMNELNTVFQAASQEMYNAASAQGGALGGAQEGPTAGSGGSSQGSSGNGKPKQDGEVTDVDFEEVK